MGYIYIKLTDIEIPNDFRVYCKEDNNANAPYPIVGTEWSDYGLLEGQPNGIYSGGTTEMILSGTSFDFQYNKMYWIKMVEVDYPDRYVIKNIKINDIIAYPFVSPPAASPSISPSVTPTTPYPSVTRTPSRTPTPTITMTPTSSITPSISVSTSIGATPSITPTITPSPSSSVSEIYFASVDGDSAILDGNNSLSRTFSVTFYWEITATVDNDYSSGENSVSTITKFLISENDGTDWTEYGSVSASIPGNGPPTEYDNQTLTGNTTVSNITDLSQVRVSIDYDCNTLQDMQSGEGYVRIESVTVNEGNATIICDDEFHAGCFIPAYLSCTNVTPSVTRTPTPTMTPSPYVIPVFVNNSSGADTSIGDVMIGTTTMISIASSMTPAFPYYPDSSGTGKSPYGPGLYNVEVYVWGTSSEDKYIKLVDSVGTEHCVNVLQTSSPNTYTFTNVNMNSSGISITFYPSGLCPSPTPSVSRTVTPTVTPSPTSGLSPSVTPSLTRTPSVTPTTSPTVFAYYIDIYNCSTPYCENYIGNSYIENQYLLEVGKWYIIDSTIICYVSGLSTPAGGSTMSINPYGYNLCDDACVAANT